MITDLKENTVTMTDKITEIKETTEITMIMIITTTTEITITDKEMTKIEIIEETMTETMTETMIETITEPINIEF